LCSRENSKEIFEKFIKSLNRKLKFIEYQSGLIPIYNPGLKSQEDNIFLLGDAASQVKATTYGGIIPGLIAAQKLKDSIAKNKNYDKLWKETIGKELNYSLRIRNILNKFTHKEYNELFEILSKKRAKNIIENLDRDHPSKLILKLAIIQPRLLKFSLKLL